MCGIRTTTTQKLPSFRNRCRIRIGYDSIIGTNRYPARKKSSSTLSSIRIAQRLSFRSAEKNSSLKWKGNWLQKLLGKQKCASQSTRINSKKNGHSKMNLRPIKATIMTTTKLMKRSVMMIGGKIHVRFKPEGASGFFLL